MAPKAPKASGAFRRHLVIPDTQCKKGVPLDHFRWIGEAIREYQPDTVIHLGDHWDCPSLSSWDGPGSLAMEGARYEDDIAAGNEALATLTGYIPATTRKVILRGNHENRIRRAVESAPKWAGTIGDHHLNDVRLGWEVVPYYKGGPGQIEIDGVVYAHFFANPNTGKPISGTITNRLAKIGTTFVQGHEQGYKIGDQQYAARGMVRYGIVAGSAYLHDEEYKGHANSHWRGIVVLNEVENGRFCEMPLTLDYLCRKSEGVRVGEFLRAKYPKLDLSLAA